MGNNHPTNEDKIRKRIQWNKDHTKQYYVDRKGDVFIRSHNNGVFGEWEKKTQTFTFKTLEDVDLSVDAGCYRIKLKGERAFYMMRKFGQECVYDAIIILKNQEIIQNKFYDGRWHGWEKFNG